MALENDDRATSEVRFDRRQGPEDQRHLVISAPERGSSEQDHGRRSRFAQGEQSAEVGVGRHDHAGFERGALEDSFVGGRMHSIVEKVDRVVPGTAESRGHARCARGQPQQRTAGPR